MTHPLEKNQDDFWRLPESLNEQTWAGDWDYYVSAAYSLQKYWQEFSVVPLWNFHFCGGRPELSLPHGLGYSWYSPLLYLMEPLHGLLSVWLILTLVGLTFFYKWIRTYNISPAPSVIGSILFVFNGYQAAHFNQGHLSFAFFNLIPVILFAFEKSARTPRFEWKMSALLVFAVFAYLTSSLPHGLFYPIGILVAYFFIKLTMLGTNWKVLVRPVILAGLGAGLAAYKLVPVVAWQKAFPREGVLSESNSLLDVIQNLLVFRPGFINHLHFSNPDQTWFDWEYSAFIGPVALLLSLTALIVWKKFTGEKRKLLFLALLLLFLGLNLGLGDKSFLSLAQFFKHFPILEGIRVFSRFQILTLFAVCILVMLALELFQELLQKYHLRALVMGLVLVPVLLQFVVLMSSIQAVANKDIEELYKKVGGIASGHWNHSGFDLQSPFSYQTVVLKNGGWVGNCYEPMNVRRISLKEPNLPLSSIVPQEMSLGLQSLHLTFPDELEPTESFTVRLSHYDFTRANATIREYGAGSLTFALQPLYSQAFSLKSADTHSVPILANSEKRQFTLYQEVPGALTGLVLSLVALLVLTPAFFWRAAKSD